MIWHIKLPLIRPSIVLITLFTIIGTLQLFVEPLVLRPLTTAISSDYTPNLAAYNQAFAQGNPNLAAAMAVIVALLAFAFSALLPPRREPEGEPRMVTQSATRPVDSAGRTMGRTAVEPPVAAPAAPARSAAPAASPAAPRELGARRSRPRTSSCPSRGC